MSISPSPAAIAAPFKNTRCARAVCMAGLSMYIPKIIFKLILGRRYNRQKKAQGGDHKSQESKDQNEPLISTAERLAAEHHVSPATVKRAEAELKGKRANTKKILATKERQLNVPRFVSGPPALIGKMRSSFGMNESCQWGD